VSDVEAEIQSLVHETIPISRQMDFQVLSLDSSGIKSWAPLAPNINIHETGFAGSLYSLAVLTAWSYATHLIKYHGLEAELVIASANIRYIRPVADDIECRCTTGKRKIEQFIDSLASGRKGKLDLEVSINNDRAILKALLVALPAD
jgi:thioesterase domain-containing protein